MGVKYLRLFDDSSGDHRPRYHFLCLVDMLPGYRGSQHAFLLVRSHRAAIDEQKECCGVLRCDVCG
jgi:hypothetical protein